MYVVLIALSPLALELLRKRWGTPALLAGCCALFAIGSRHPWFGAVAARQDNPQFPPILWQLIFIIGMVIGAISSVTINWLAPVKSR